MEDDPHVYDCLIIGAGVAGIAAARELQKSGKDIRVISPDVGGRYVEGPNKVNYGAYFSSKSYRNLRPFLKFSERIWLSELSFHGKEEKAYGVFGLRLLRIMPEAVKVTLLSIRFRIHLARMRRRALIVGQAQAIKEDAYLDELFHMHAAVWYKQHGLSRMVGDFFDELAYDMSFTSSGNHNAFFSLQWMSESICCRLYRVSLDLERFSRSVRHCLVRETATGIDMRGGGVTVRCGRRTFRAKSLIIATAPWAACELVPSLPAASFASAYMYHVEGRLRPAFRKKKYNLFAPHHPLISTTVEADGTHLVYARHPFSDLGRYFETFKVIKEIAWTPCIRMNSRRLYDEKIADNVYQATTLNLEGLEDAFINGTFCARKIAEYLDEG